MGQKAPKKMKNPFFFGLVMEAGALHQSRPRKISTREGEVLVPGPYDGRIPCQTDLWNDGYLRQGFGNLGHVAKSGVTGFQLKHREGPWMRIAFPVFSMVVDGRVALSPNEVMQRLLPLLENEISGKSNNYLKDFEFDKTEWSRIGKDVDVTWFNGQLESALRLPRYTKFCSKYNAISDSSAADVAKSLPYCKHGTKWIENSDSINLDYSSADREFKVQNDYIERTLLKNAPLLDQEKIQEFKAKAKGFLQDKLGENYEKRVKIICCFLLLGLFVWLVLDCILPDGNLKPSISIRNSKAAADHDKKSKSLEGKMPMENLNNHKSHGHLRTKSSRKSKLEISESESESSGDFYSNTHSHTVSSE